MPVNKAVLRVFQREVEHQCRFVFIAAEDMRQALQDMESLGDEMDRRFEERASQEISARLGRVPAARGPFLIQMSMQDEFGDWWEHFYAVRARFWYSVQSLLVAAANISKLLWPTYRGKKENLVPGRGEELRNSLAIGEEHAILSPPEHLETTLNIMTLGWSNGLQALINPTYPIWA
jgi:hypothetical protein